MHPIWHKGENDEICELGQEHYRRTWLRERRKLWARGAMRPI
jgi:hypothetical protein